jgi:DNA mismatch repair protein MutS
MAAEMTPPTQEKREKKTMRFPAAKREGPARSAGRTENATPAMRQFLEIKSRHPDSLLFFQMGDFFEMFYEDAQVGGKVLELTLTSRQKDGNGPIPMCGVPIHAVDTYSARLLEAGFKVAICEQTESPGAAKGVVKREVVRVLTPGTVGDPALVDSKESCYLAGLFPGNGKTEGGWGIAWVDMSTGEFCASEIGGEGGASFLADELERLRPRELLIPEGVSLPTLAAVRIDELGARLETRSGATSRVSSAVRALSEQFEDDDILEARANDHPLASVAAAGLLAYLRENQPGELPHLRPLTFTRRSDAMLLDAATQRNLELVRSAVDGGRRGTLLELMDETLTPMGGRLMKRWVLSPLVSVDVIAQRADAVEAFLQEADRLSRLREALEGIQDLERILGRVSVQTANARDLIGLGHSLAALPQIPGMVHGMETPFLRDILAGWDSLEDLCESLCATLREDPPLTLRDGGLVRDGVDPELDRLRSARREGKSWIESYAGQERERTGLPIKVGFNRVFGFYLELPKRYSEEIPLEYARKQTLVSAERYITSELKEIEDDVLGAEEKSKELEYVLFGRLRASVVAESKRILAAADRVARLDSVASLAEIARSRDYVRPVVDESQIIEIEEGRHPVMEADTALAFVPNDLRAGGDRQILIVTGPNMAGKSTYLRQAALIILMAQMGSFVPAKATRIGLVDRVFTRVGAHDRLLEGQSTFMVEMVETAAILREATPRSFVVLDEVGRGTSTYDGVSIAWAIVEYLHESKGHRARTLFATHYHEMADLTNRFPRVANLTVEVREWGEEVVFLRKVSDGSCDRSYGIHVGRLAGLPSDVIGRAREILAGLEEGRTSPGVVDSVREATPPDGQLSLFGGMPSRVEAALSKVNPDALSPRQALEVLYDLRSMLQTPQNKEDSGIEG